MTSDERVADVEDIKKYVPASWEKLLTHDARYEIVWFVNDTDGLLRGELVDTILSVWAPISVIKLDPDDRETWAVVSLDDTWTPCDDPEGEWWTG